MRPIRSWHLWLDGSHETRQEQRDGPVRSSLGEGKSPVDRAGFQGGEFGVWMSLLVAHRGFEPLISALRGRCPRPLDECAATF